MVQEKKLQLSLFLLRVSVFIVMLIWTLDKFIRPEHAAKIFEMFYFAPPLGAMVMYVLGALEMVLIIAFVVGAWKKLTYGLVLVLHAISTLSSFMLYLAPYQEANILMFAAWPMLAACITLFLLRDQDTLCACRCT